jgi:hypothetical protein
MCSMCKLACRQFQRFPASQGMPSGAAQAKLWVTAKRRRLGMALIQARKEKKPCRELSARLWFLTALMLQSAWGAAL